MKNRKKHCDDENYGWAGMWNPDRDWIEKEYGLSEQEEMDRIREEEKALEEWAKAGGWYRKRTKSSKSK